MSVTDAIDELATELAEERYLHQQTLARCAELEKERDDALESTAWKLMGALQKSEARLATLKAALEVIASVPCQIACASLPGATRCVTCVARAALQEGD